MPYINFIKAARDGDLSTIEIIANSNQTHIVDIVSADSFAAFRRAAKSGYLHVLEKLIELAPAKVLDMVRENDFEAFGVAAQNGHLHVIEKLIKLDSDNVQNMVCACDFDAFREAAGNGHLHVLEKLIKLAPGNVLDMVCADDFYAFREAAGNGHLAVLERLIELVPGLVQEMVRANNFNAFWAAAGNGHLAVLERLIELVPGLVQEMVRANNFNAFVLAARKGHHTVIARLLNFPAVFAYAERHVHEFSRQVQDFMNTRLAHLAQEIDTFHATRPNEVFNVANREQAHLYFYMMRHLIRQRTPEPLNQLNLLLSIPSVRALAHQEVSRNQSNELLRLAMSLNNQDAVLMLLNIPAVRNLAQINHFYQQEQRSGLDLSALAQDRESSMIALTQGEQQALECARTKYQPEIDARGVANIMGELKALLAAHYNAHPATVQTGDGRDIPLPLDFDEYQTLATTLSADTRERALQSYYQHPDHTALRYLSKPNPWMSIDAHFVNRSPKGAWSTFDEYQQFISLLYLAAKDEAIPGINGYNVETRVENFIKELALIGRAHNWDASRINPATGLSEEYDDLQGDKPSCYSGVKRRLFQSVQGHPLLTLLTKDMILLEVRDTVRDHFIHCISDKNCADLQKTWQALINGEEADPSILAQLNFSEEKHQSVVKKFTDKYGTQLDRELQAYLFTTLSINQPFKNLAEKFGGQVGLTEILETKAKEIRTSPPSISVLGGSFFEQQTSSETSDSPKDGALPKNKS